MRRTQTSWRLLVLLILSSACPKSDSDPKLVDVATIDPTIAFDIRYAGTNNFVGEAIDGYEAPRCLLTPQAAGALVRAQRQLRERGLGLLIYDCYRPQRAVDQFVRWAKDLSDTREKARFYPHVPKSELLARGYIASRSSHSRGSTVDLTLVRLSGPERGDPLDMGTDFDLFDPKSHTAAENVSEAARENRRTLVDAMTAAGFENLPVEWWHYTLKDEPYPSTYFDVVIR
ncbi:MAG: M15 family metallopeptidase [Myxococcota bacterium]